VRALKQPICRAVGQVAGTGGREGACLRPVLLPKPTGHGQETSSPAPLTAAPCPTAPRAPLSVRGASGPRHWREE